jgi:putative redox protein
MKNQRIEFSGAQGDRLSGLLSLPADERVSAYALFAHCFTCSKDLKPVVNISRALTRRGIGVFRFDFTGLGESEGDFEDTGFSSNVGDLLAAAEYMGRELQAPAILIGHSLGGAAVINAAGSIPSAQAVCTIAAPFDPGHVTHLFSESLETIREQGRAEVLLAGRPFTVTLDFLEDLTEQRQDDAIRTLGRPLLIFHSPVDNTVGIENAGKIYTAAKHPKSFVSLDDADHLLLREADSLYVGDVLASWARRYVTYDDPAASLEELRAENAVTSRTESEGFRTDVVTRRHTLVADEPEAVGGTDLGPTPYDLLSASLGACTTMTLQMYARRKEWPLTSAVVSVEHDRVHAEDEVQCELGEPRVDRLTRTVALEGELDDAQRARLMEIADRCPIHRTLSAGVFIDTAAGDGPS